MYRILRGHSLTIGLVTILAVSVLVVGVTLWPTVSQQETLGENAWNWSNHVLVLIPEEARAAIASHSRYSQFGTFDFPNKEEQVAHAPQQPPDAATLEYCVEWITRTVRPTWVPPELSSHLIPVKAWANGRDALVVRYVLNEHAVQIIHTRSETTVVVAPLGDVLRKPAEAHAELMRETIMEVLSVAPPARFNSSPAGNVTLGLCQLNRGDMDRGPMLGVPAATDGRFVAMRAIKCFGPATPRPPIIDAPLFDAPPAPPGKEVPPPPGDEPIEFHGGEPTPEELENEEGVSETVWNDATMLTGADGRARWEKYAPTVDDPAGPYVVSSPRGAEVESCMGWMRRIVNPGVLPAELRSHLLALKGWPKYGGEDVFVTWYVTGGRLIYVVEGNADLTVFTVLLAEEPAETTVEDHVGLAVGVAESVLTSEMLPHPESGARCYTRSAVPGVTAGSWRTAALDLSRDAEGRLTMVTPSSPTGRVVHFLTDGEFVRLQVIKAYPGPRAFGDRSRARFEPADETEEASP